MNVGKKKTTSTGLIGLLFPVLFLFFIDGEKRKTTQESPLLFAKDAE
jgi:hypothetical protein